MSFVGAAPGFASQSALSASAFVGSIGVNTHLTYTDTVYGNVGSVMGAMDWLGLDLVRDYLPSFLPGPYEQLAAQGFRFNFFFPGDGQLGAYVDGLTAFAQAHPGQIVALEGPNEVNFWPVTWNGATNLPAQAAFQFAYNAALNANPVLKDIPVYNLSLGGVGADTFRVLGDLTGAADYANAHVYYGPGGSPAASWDYALGLARIPMPGRGAVVTETGYSTAANDPQGVDEATQAKHVLNLLMDSAKSGVIATYLYELVDQRNDPSRADRENNFGLFHSDWTPKIAAHAIHNFTTILTDGGVAPSGAALAYNVSGLSSPGNHMLFQEGNGVLDIVVWAEPDIWDEAARVPIAVGAQAVTITLPAAVGGYAVYDPLYGTSPIATGGATTQITVQVTDHPLIIALYDGAPPAAWAFQIVEGGLNYNGGPADDVVVGTAATDIVRGWDGADSIHGGAAFDDLNGNVGTDTVHGGDGNDFVLGGKDNDQVSGDEGDDIVNGNIGTDLVLGGNGNDTVRGGQGDDSVAGGAGADWVSGDRGSDTVSGGDGADIFHIFAGAGLDRVIDFSSASGDRVQLLPGQAYTVTYLGADTVIDLGGGDQLVLVGVTQSSLGNWLLG